MSEPEQCIICLDPLPRSSNTNPINPPDPPEDIDLSGSEKLSPNAEPTLSEAIDEELSYLNVVAALDGCDHIIHDACIRSWAQKTNTCPICRKPFHTVRVYNGVDGSSVSTYDVQDKKQVVEFDVQQWLGENPDEEDQEVNPCPICNSSEHEDVLLLCDSCDAAYHTHCLGIEDVPEGDWYCIECRHLFADDSQEVHRLQPRNDRGYRVRTRARQRRARRQARNVEWAGAWGQFSGRFYEMSELDLDNHDEEDDELEQFRRFQQLDRRELQRWQQRVNIAHRLGVSETFTHNIPPGISQHLQEPASIPQPVQETPDERRAWGAFDIARETDAPVSSSGSRKRKVRSITASPTEPMPEPERKLKRPRTRRLTTQGEGSNSAPPQAAGPSTVRVTNGSSHHRPPPISVSPVAHDPPLVSSLLKELEPLENNATSDDEQAPTSNGGWRGAVEASSPVMSPAASAHSSPRALSITPPPVARSTSPILSLSTNIEPRYPPANYSPNRHNGDHSDSENRPSRSHNQSPELRQPRPQRLHRLPVRTQEELSPTRATMTQEEKKSINDIVKTALRPHWRAQKLTTEQYANINRDISRKLYEQVKDMSSLENNAARKTWEMRATQEVAQAIAGLQA